MKTGIFVIALSGIAAIVANSDPASATAVDHHHRAKHQAAQQQQQIACTVLGCITVPPQCGQTYGRTPGGIPTGYDIILCPPGVSPLK
jgi:hypothetical protein